MPDNTPPRWAALTALALLAACGKAPEPAASTPVAKTAPARATAARPEDEMPPPRCPPPASSAPAGPDIVGLRLGMEVDTALNHARCALPDGVFAISPRWFQQLRPGQVTLSRQAFNIQRGETSECSFKQLGDAQKCGLGRRVWDHVDELVSVATPGLDGRQMVAGIWRQQQWKPGQMPSRDAVLAALRDKYGREGELRNDPHGTIHWRWNAAGQPLAATDPRFQQCWGIQARHDSSQRWSEGCGLSISADLVPARDNPQLVQALYVGMAHQERLLALGAAMQAELDRLDAARRATEVQQAASTAPRL